MSETIIDLKEKNMGKKVSRYIIAAIIAVLAIVVLANSFCTIQAGHTGVVTTFGKVSEKVLEEGLHFKIPFIQQVIQIDNRVLKTDVESSSASKDLQMVSSTISVNYRVARNKSASIYQNVGVYFDDVIVKPAIQECVKSVTAQYTAEELITNRQVISQKMEDALSAKINPYGLNIEVFNIISFDFSEEFNKAIEAKQTAQQNALKAEQDLARVKIEAQQAIEKAKAEAEAYRLKNQEITEAMIRMEYINKWDGKLPYVISDGANILDIGGIIDEAQKSENANSQSATTSQAGE
ncbi:MAG: prohibitin 2 [Clostridiales bacterium]|jgi:regulator of protease activity HflC (stomatin/prohibitin superfamily)|nr:HflC protein [Oscillospiraceae bacterium]MDN5378800.1 prohibitin 2 [Clostridiales bacterium]